MNQLLPLLKDATPKAKAGFAAGAVGTLVVLLLLFKVATAPSYETMLTGLDPADTGKITKALDEQAVAYEIQNGGTALGVKSADSARARIALAESGLPGKGQPGFELFEKQKMGTSDFQQQVNYQRALEGEIANTIQQVDGVSGAKVQLVLPDDQLFADEKKPATAAVLLSGSTSNLDPNAVRGMAQLVSSSVEGLSLDKVTITDGTGQLLWPREGADGGSLTKQAAEQRHEQALESELMALLGRTVGVDKAQVQVRSTLNLDKAKERKLTYDRRDRVALKRETEEETLEGAGGAAGGTAGTRANVPGYAGAAAGAGQSNYARTKANTDFGVGKTVRDTEFAQGAVEKQNVAVVLDASVSPAVAKEVEDAVSVAAGLDPTRGDTLTVNRIAFAKPEAPKTASPIAGYVGYAKYAVLGLAVLLFLFFATRTLRRRERDALGEPQWLREINAPAPLAALEAQSADAMVNLDAQRRNEVRKRAEELAAKDPGKVAQQLRSWMQEEA